MEKAVYDAKKNMVTCDPSCFRTFMLGKGKAGIRVIINQQAAEIIRASSVPFNNYPPQYDAGDAVLPYLVFAWAENISEDFPAWDGSGEFTESYVQECDWETLPDMPRPPASAWLDEGGVHFEYGAMKYAIPAQALADAVARAMYRDDDEDVIEAKVGEKTIRMTTAAAIMLGFSKGE